MAKSSNAAQPARKKVAGRKLTKAESHKLRFAPKNLKKATSAFMRHACALGKKEFHDDSIVTAGEAGGLVIGLKLPSFSLEYLLQNTVLPLGIVMQVVGLQGSCKSGFGFEVARWFRKYSGITHLYEHETKYSPDWAMSILDWDGDALSYWPCDSINDWQARLQWGLREAQKFMTGTGKENPGSGRTWPFLSIVDSLMGKGMKESQDKIEKNGFAGRNHPLEALSITQYLRAIPQKCRKWPFVIMTINHLKPTQDANGITQRNKAGGRGLDFQETLEIELVRTGKIELADRDGLHLQLRCYKNSLGITGRRIPVDIVWWDEEVDYRGDVSWRQRTVWNWHASSIELLMQLINGKQKTKANKVREITGLVPGKGKTVHSKILGIPRESPLTYHEAGEILFNNQEVMEQLRRLFGIKTRKVFTNDLDYLDQLKTEKRLIKHKIDELDLRGEVSVSTNGAPHESPAPVSRKTVTRKKTTGKTKPAKRRLMPGESAYGATDE